MLYVILSPVGAYFKGQQTLQGVSLLADPRYTRAWPGGCGDKKMGSNYAPTLRVQKEAAEKGLQQVLWLYGEDHEVTEVGTMNIFMFYINDEGGNLLEKVEQFRIDNGFKYFRKRISNSSSKWTHSARNSERLNFVYDKRMESIQNYREKIHNGRSMHIALAE